MTLLRRILPLTALLALAIAPAATATHPQPPLDLTKVDYDPIGHFKPGDPMHPSYGTACEEAMKPLLKGKIFNPSGKFNAHDMNVYESNCLPWRNQDDTSATDPMGNGDPDEARYGYCADASMTAEPTSAEAAGKCPNHQLEYIEHFQAQMQEILGPFGVTFQTYEFEHSEGIGRNPAAIVVGSDHPEQHILIGSHYDQTDSGPASVWDSQEGHAEMIRIAKMMADYWTATGTRPSATVKFVPMDAEEDGLLGSQDYVNNTIAPEQEANVRGYFNADPCAGGYPAFHYGTANRVDMGIQIGDSTEPDVVAFNEQVPAAVEAIFDRVDDVMESRGGFELFRSSAEAPGGVGDIGTEVFIDVDQPVVFSSDWANFIAVGIPFFNPGPEVTGPNVGGTPGPNTLGTPEALYMLHTPLDNYVTMNRYTGGNPTGMEFSEGYIKGMEFCSNMIASMMLRPDMGGTQTINTKPVAYFEALPNEAQVKNFVNFDGGGSRQYADASGKLVPQEDLQYKWDFGDGTPTAYGVEVKHSYKRAGTYASKLTLTNRNTNESSTFELPIVVEEGTGTDEDPADQFVDRVPAKNSVVACQSNATFTKVSATPSGKGLKFNFATTSGAKPTLIEVYLAGKSKSKRVFKRSASKSFTWRGKKGLKRGTYFVRMSAVGSNGRRDDRYFAFTRTSKFKKAKSFARAGSCELVSLFRLSAPAFGKRLKIGVATTEASAVEVRVLRGKRTVKRFRRTSEANRALSFTLSGRKLKRGVYKVVLKATAGGKTVTQSLYTRKL